MKIEKVTDRVRLIIPAIELKEMIEEYIEANSAFHSQLEVNNMRMVGSSFMVGVPSWNNTAIVVEADILE